MQIDFYQQACQRIEDEAEDMPHTLDDYLENDLVELSRYARELVNHLADTERHQFAFDQISLIQRMAINRRIHEEADQLADELEAEDRAYWQEERDEAIREERLLKEREAA